jgi:ABC-2 type transport system permease protein
MSAGTSTTPHAGTGHGPAAGGSTATAAGSPFTGTVALVRLALRRDRILIPVWLFVFVAMAGSTAKSTLALYPDTASLRGIASSINGNPASLALYGRIFDIDSAGAVALFKMGALGASMVAVLTMILIVRHTRGEEEAGRLELLGAGVVGRYAALTAALVVTGATALLLGLLTAASLVSAGLPSGGSVAFGLAWALCGLSFAAVAAIMAQLTTGARAATGLTAAVLGGTFLLRAVGDIATDGDPLRWASWLSPVGWSQQVRPFAGDRWWVFGIGLLFVVAAVAVAYQLVARRDVGAGLLADRPGPARAGRGLAGSTGLALRLQRGILLAWTGGFVLIGLVAGSLAKSIGSFVDTPGGQELIAKLGGHAGLVDSFIAMYLGILAIITSIFTIQSVLRLRSEEAGLRAEPLLATAIGRRRWVAGHLTVAVLGSVWLLIVAGLAMGLAASMTLHDGAQFGRIVGAALVQIPSVLVMAGIAVAVFGLLPRVTAAAWALLVAFLLIGELGPLFDIDQRVLDVSPFAHTPRLPGGALTWTPLFWLTAVAVALTVTGLEAFRRRDLD